MRGAAGKGLSMTTEEKSILGAQPFLRGLPDEHLAKLALLCRHVAVPARHRLFEEGARADRFWLLDAGQVTLDATVPGRGRVIIERLGRGDIVGLSWMLPPYQWGYGAMTTQPMQAFEFDARAVRAACEQDPALGYEVTRRFSAAVVHRLQATRARLLEAYERAELVP
jgi:CRP/FNR family transcriptional regulator, cyclic AMP receptor protein